jgi:hypothetical protein
MKKILLCLIAALLLTGCGSKDQPEGSDNNTGKAAAEQETKEDTSKETASNDAAQAEPGYVFDYNGTSIQMNTDVAPVLEALGDPQEYFEAKSCAFNGLDKTYYYSGIELTTYPNGDKDFISSIYFKDDSVSTTEGIYIGSTLEEMLAAYGEDYTGDTGSYTYTKGDSSIMFIVENDEVTSITYLAVVEGLQ